MKELIGNSSVFEDAESCSIDATLVRKREGNLDKNFGEGGTIIAVQKRSKAFKYDPSDE